MRVRLHKFQAGGSIIASTYQPITVTPGAYAPSLQQAEQAITMAMQSGGQQQGASGKSDELTKKDLLQSIKGIDGLPSDVNFVINKISHDLSMAEILRNPITGQSPIDISDAYLQGIQYLNQVRNSKATFDNAYKSATSNGSINEAAITSSGLVVVKDDKGNLNTVTAQDYLNNKDKYRVQTNGDLLQARRMDPNFTFSDNILDIVENGASTEAIIKFINQFSSGLGTDTLQQQGYSKVAAQRVVNGLDIIQEAQKNGINLTGGIDGIYKTTKLTEDQKRQATEAITALYKMMPQNYRSLLAVKSGNAENPDKGVFDLITLMVDKSANNKVGYQVDKVKEASKKDGDSDSEGSLEKTKEGAAGQWFREQGEKTSFNLSLDGSQGFVVHGVVGGITDTSEKPIGNNATLSEVSNSSFGNGLDTNNATFGNGMRIDVNGSNKVIVDGTRLVSAELPIDPNSSTPKPDFDLLKKKEKADEVLKAKYNIDPDNYKNLTKSQWHYINTVYKQYDIPPRFDENTGKLLEQRWRRFGLLKGTLTQESLLGDVNEKYISKIDSSNQINNYQQLRRIKSGDNKYSFSNSIFGGDTLYQGTIFIPVTDSYMTMTSGSGKERTLAQQEAINSKDEATQIAIDNGGKPVQMFNMFNGQQ